MIDNSPSATLRSPGIYKLTKFFSFYIPFQIRPFEDLAKQILDENPTLKQEFEAKKQTDKAFADNGGDQLYWVYKHSKYFEKAYMMYPVFRMN